jgi:hypothetical protein
MVELSAQPPPRLDPIRRLRVLAAAIPGAAVAEGVLDAPFDAVWAAATDFEHVGGIEILIKEAHIRSRRPDPETGGERIEVEYKPRPFGPRDVIDVDLRPGWCWMQSPLAVAAMAAVPEGERTRFAHLEAVRFPGRRLFGPLLAAKMALARELRRFERKAQELARGPGPGA